jgi:hypothetical protein
VPTTLIGIDVKWSPSAGLVMTAGVVTGGPATLAVTSMSAPALKVQAIKKTPAQSSRNKKSGYEKTDRFLRLLICLAALFLVFWRAIFVF